MSALLQVTLGVPYLEKEDQHYIFSKDQRFDTSDEQVVAIGQTAHFLTLDYLSSLQTGDIAACARVCEWMLQSATRLRAGAAVSPNVVARPLPTTLGVSLHVHRQHKGTEVLRSDGFAAIARARRG